MFDTKSEQVHTTASTPDNRPRFGIGHVAMPSTDIDRLTEFYVAIGMRLEVNMGRMSILELRDAGADPSAIRRGNPHDRFIATDPEGNTLVVNSNHAIGPV